jgi:RNA polymerase sigma-70 factor (ECF subfamily)
MCERSDKPETAISAGELAGKAVTPYWRVVREFIRRRTRNSQDAGDIEQETYFKIVCIKDKELVINNPIAFLITLASRSHSELVRKQIKERAHTVSINDVDELVESVLADSRERYADDDPEERTHYAGGLEKVEKALAKMPRNESTALVLVERDGLTNAQAAERLGLTTLTVKTYIKRARMKLRKQLKNDLYFGEANDKG